MKSLRTFYTKAINSTGEEREEEGWFIVIERLSGGLGDGEENKGERR